MSKEKTSTKNRYERRETGQFVAPEKKQSSAHTTLAASPDKRKSASGNGKQSKPSVRVVTVRELNNLERDTSETARAIIKSVRATYKNIHGSKKVKSA
jgi:hypothetical protein